MLGSALPAERNAGQQPVPIDTSDVRPVLDEGEQVARLVDAGLPVRDRRARHAKRLGDGSLSSPASSRDFRSRSAHVNRGVRSGSGMSTNAGWRTSAEAGVSRCALFKEVLELLLVPR